MSRPEELLQTLHGIQSQIEDACLSAGRAKTSCQLLPVSKTKPISDLRILYDAGIRAFGENYVQEALEKMATLDHGDIEWHYIGHIQSNKTRVLAESFDWIHTVDRFKIANRLNEAREKHPLNILIQVNIDQSASKSGISLDALDDLVEAIDLLPNLSLRGLMSIPDPTHASHLKASHDQLFAAFTRLKSHVSDPAKFDTLSMGMTNDLQLAIASGSTMVRIGTALFGKRLPKE
jgi:pyridoxal phosphate enzyme (YggS family)